MNEAGLVRRDNNIDEICAHNTHRISRWGCIGIKKNVCPRCGEPVQEGGTICMVCGQSLKKRFTLPRKGVVVAILGVTAIIFIYLLMSVFFGATTVTSTGNVRFGVTLEDGAMSVEYEGTADGRDVTDLRIAILAEGGQSSRLLSFKNPHMGAVLGPVETGTTGKPVAVYYVVVYTDGTEISDAIPI